MNKIDLRYCVYILPEVSRTFAINIKSLRSSSVYSGVLIAYLICRAADTIEDSESLSVERQIGLLRGLKEILKEENEKNLETWMKSYSNISHHFYENNLMENFDKVFRSYLHLKEEEKKAMIEPISTMIEGMAIFLEKYKHTSPIVFKDLKETELYCYYAAGTVGELLTKLFVLNGEDAAKLDPYKIDFGAGLQLTNILKDFISDYHARGISYIPEELLSAENISLEDFVLAKRPEKTKAIVEKLVTLAKEKLDKALVYSLALKDDKNRLFCLLPLFFALATLKKIKSNKFHEEKYLNKISKWEVFSIHFRLKWMRKKNKAIEAYYQKIWESQNE